MTTSLQLAPKTALPLNVIVDKIAIYGRSGSGKTNTSTVFVEEALAANQQVVIIDPPGAWWGLRSSADGNSEGFPITILGGEHGDLQLSPDAGETAAGIAVDQHANLILDLSDMSLGEIAKFGEDFLRNLYEMKARERSPMLLVVEEADELIPQQPAPNQTRCLAAGERIAKRGRMRGIGSLWITQRPASTNKNVTSQAGVLIAMQTLDPRDVKAIDDWLQPNVTAEERRMVLDNIGKLPIGTGFICWPQHQLFDQVAIRQRRTFDSSKTPQPGESIVEPATQATIDLGPLELALEQGGNETLPNNVNALKRRIAELESRPEHASSDTAQLEETIRQLEADNVIKLQEITRLHAELDWLYDNRSHGHVHILALITALDNATTNLQALQKTYAPAELNRSKIHLVEPADELPATFGQVKPIPPPKALRHEAATTVNPLNYTLRDGERRIMETVALFHGAGINRQQLATLAGLSAKSGSFGTYLSNLQKLDIIQATQAGYVPGPKCLVDHSKDIPSHDSLMDLWCRKLKPSIARMLRYLEQHPKGLTRNQLAGLMGMSATSGSFGQYIADLKKNQLTETTKTHIKPSRYLWPEQAP